MRASWLMVGGYCANWHRPKLSLPTVPCPGAQEADSGSHHANCLPSVAARFAVPAPCPTRSNRISENSPSGGTGRRSTTRRRRSAHCARRPSGIPAASRAGAPAAQPCSASRNALLSAPI